jgi:hypothetical protein
MFAILHFSAVKKPLADHRLSRRPCVCEIGFPPSVRQAQRVGGRVRTKAKPSVTHLGRRLCCLPFVAAPSVHPAQARRIAANIARLPVLIRK